MGPDDRAAMAGVGSVASTEVNTTEDVTAACDKNTRRDGELFADGAVYGATLSKCVNSNTTNRENSKFGFRRRFPVVLNIVLSDIR